MSFRLILVRVQGAGLICGENLGAGFLFEHQWTTFWFLILEEGLRPASALALAWDPEPYIKKAQEARFG